MPSIDKKGLFNYSLSVRGITLSGVNSYSIDAFTQDFTGKFWWDEENIINNQVEAAKRNTATLEAENSSTSNVEVESHSVQVSVPCEPDYSEQERENKTWNYDLLKNPNNSEGINKINSLIQESMDKSVQKAESVPYGRGGDRAIITRNVKVSFINDKVVCYSDGNYSTGWGPHGSHDVGSVVFDLNTGEVIDVASYLGITQSELLSNVQQALSINLSNKPSDTSAEKIVDAVKLEKDDPLGISLEGITKLGFSKNGVLYYTTAEYELGSYAAGTRAIVVGSENASDFGKNLSEIEG